MRTWLLRVVALAIIATLSVMSSRSLLAIGLCLLASLGTCLLWLDQWPTRRQTEPRFWLARSTAEPLPGPTAGTG